MTDTQPTSWPHAENLRTIRGPLSTEKAARKIDVSRQTWVAWESGNSEPRYHNLKAIIEEFGCPPAMVGYEPPRGWELVPAEWISEEFAAVHRELRCVLDAVRTHCGE